MPTRNAIVFLSLGLVGCDATLSPTGAVAVQGPTATQVFGWNPLKQPDEPALVGVELTARVGFFRGALGRDGSGDTNVVSAGFYGGFAFGVPIRLARAVEPWENDEMFSRQCSLVPWIGLNTLVPNGDFANETRGELAAGLGARFTLSSSFFP